MGASYYTTSQSNFKAGDRYGSLSMKDVRSTCKEPVKCVPCDNPIPGCVSAHRALLGRSRAQRAPTRAQRARCARLANIPTMVLPRAVSAR